MPTSVALLTSRVDLMLTKDEFRTVDTLSKRFGTSRAAVARLLVKEGIRRVDRLGAFTVEEINGKTSS